jgi:hypothetical protein
VPTEKRSKLDNKVVKCIFFGYGVGVKWYKLWDHVVEKDFYRRNVIFREVKSSPIVMQPEEHEKKLVVQLPLNTKKVEI